MTLLWLLDAYRTLSRTSALFFNKENTLALLAIYILQISEINGSKSNIHWV